MSRAKAAIGVALRHFGAGLAKAAFFGWRAVLVQGKLAFLSIDSVSYDSTTDTIDTALSLKSKLDPQTVTVALKRGFKPPASFPPFSVALYAISLPGCLE